MKKLAVLLVLFILCGCAQDEKVTKLGEELRRMKSDTDVGVNYKDYTSRLRDLNFAVSEVVDKELGSKEMRENAGLALDSYDRAAAAWHLDIYGENDTARLKDDMYRFPKGSPVEDDIKLIEATSGLELRGKKEVTMQELVQKNWESAEEHADKALKEIE